MIINILTSKFVFPKLLIIRVSHFFLRDEAGNKSLDVIGYSVIGLPNKRPLISALLGQIDASTSATRFLKPLYSKRIGQ